jgi:hypothetical protein
MILGAFQTSVWEHELTGHLEVLSLGHDERYWVDRLCDSLLR